MRARLLVLVVFLLLIGGVSTITSAPKKANLIESVSNFMCPAQNGNFQGSIYLGSQRVKSAVIDNKNRAPKKASSRVIPLADKSLVVTGESAAPLVMAMKSGTWLALSQCGTSTGELWFVGGSADVSSLGYLQFSNENLGKAIIDVELWSEEGSEPTRTLTIPARSTKNYSLTTFMPGKKLTTFHIVSRSGLVSASLLDERRKGLQNLGADFVAPAAPPSKSVVVAGIPGPKFIKNSKFASQRLRVFVPGESDALVKLTYLSSSGVFSPVGLDSVRVPARKVVEIDLSNLPREKIFSLEVQASEPIVATVITRGNFSGRQEIVSSSSSLPTNGQSIVLPEQSGYLVFVSKATQAKFNVIGSGAKRSSITQKIDQIGIWKVPDTARMLTFTSHTAPMYLGFLTANSSGVAGAGLSPTEVKELTQLPELDSRLYIPRS